MDAILLTWRFQNILSIAIMVILIYFGFTLVAQGVMRYEGQKAADNG